MINLYTINHYINDFFVFLRRQSDLRDHSRQIVIEAGEAPGKFEFVNVSFHYPNDPRTILKNINLTIEPGECLVIVGENGAGKTTLIKLLMRLYDVTSGAILYNGVNIKDYDYDSYMNVLATVFQDYKLFAVSVYENITFKEAEEHDAAVHSLLEQNNLSAKIQSLPHQERTVLSRRFDRDGVELSGGQAQRIAFCRAMYKQSQVIILDEPSASLSPIAENEMYIHFSQMIKNKTTIFISHRLSSSSISDKICVLDDGEIVEYGTHNELILRNGLYKEMYEIQSQYYKESV
nr:ATP-binding cassette domain-containing protein [Paenibacillus thiaminolyticus]